MKFNFGRLHDEAIRVPGFCREDAGVMDLDAVCQANAVLRHSCSLRMFYPDLPMMLLQLDVDRKACLSGVDLATLTGDTVYWCSQPQVAHYWPHIPGTLPSPGHRLCPLRDPPTKSSL
jgi:hypothetical protein